MRLQQAILILLLFGCHIATAQIRLGIRGGLNVSDVVMNDIVDVNAEDDFDLKLGYHSGVFASWEVKEKWSAAAELLHTVKGVTAAGNKIDLHYIVLPMLVQYAITENFKAEGGFELGYLIVADSRYGTVYSWNNKLDLGLDAGVQISVTERAHLGLRFNAGMLSVIEPHDPDPNAPKIKYQNRVLSLSLGYVVAQVKQR